MACDSTNGNILPINLDLDNMVNVSPQLSHFVYDFTPCATYKVKYGCPRWLTLFNNTNCEGSIEIIQDQVTDDLLNFATIGNLTGTGGGSDNHKNKITYYYFPQSLNLYDGGEPDGGELVIELEKKIRGQSGGSRMKKELFLIFMPVYQAKSGEMAKSIEWFKSVIPKRPLSREYITHTTANVSLNNVLPKAPFWVYNDIKIHGTCGDNMNEGFSYGEVTAIFFMEQTVLVDNATYLVSQRLGQSTTSVKFCKGKDGDNNTISWDCNFLPGEDGTNGKKCPSGDSCNIEDPASGNDAQKWMAAWYPTTISQEATEDAETEAKEDKEDDEEATPADAQDGAPAGVSSGATGDSVKKAEIILRTLEKVRRCCIFKNEVGTTLGPGLHNKTGDPFSLTCEPIVDAEDGSPIEGKDRLEWVKDVYKGVPAGLKSMFWIVLFVIILTGILAGIYTFIFKNIGLFITQNEIAGRENLK